MRLSLFSHPEGVEPRPGTRVVYDVERNEAHFGPVAVHGPALVWDLGCNDGRYSRIAAESAGYVVALDADVRVVDELYSALKAEDARTILPLFGDIADPSPALGWRSGERRTLVERGAPDVILALALVHHLAISRTVPLRELVDWFAELGSERLGQGSHRCPYGLVIDGLVRQPVGPRVVRLQTLVEVEGRLGDAGEGH